MAEQDRTEFERRDPMEEDVIGRAEDEEFEEGDEEMDEDETSEDI